MTHPGNTLAGTSELIRLILRRDRVVLASWILIALSLPLLSAAALGSMFDTAEQRRAFVDELMGNPLVSAFHGPIHSTDAEGLVAWRSLLQGIFATGLGSLLLVIRHTRADEQAGRRELLGAGVVGRHAGLTAVLGVVFAANMLIAVLLGCMLIFAVEYSVAGSIAFPMVLAASGCLFAAVAAVAAQLAESAAVARIIAIGTFGALWAIRMLGDAGGFDGALSWAVWLSPLGWAGFVRAYAGEQWWIFLLFFMATVALTTVAYVLSARRDVGSGMIPARLGPAEAPPGLRSPLGLAWRLHRGLLMGTGIAFALLGSAIGWVSASLQELLSSSPSLAAWLASMSDATLGDALLALSVYIMVAMFVTAYAITTALRAHSEEAAAHLASVLSTPISRTHWLGSHLLFAVVGPALLTVIIGICAGLTYGLGTGQPGELPGHVAMALKHLPAAWVMAGIAILLFGRSPRMALPATWGILAFFVFLVSLWEGGAIEQPLFNPLTYTHPILEPSPVTLAVLSLVAAALMALGTLAFRRRDID